MLLIITHSLLLVSSFLLISNLAGSVHSNATTYQNQNRRHLLQQQPEPKTILDNVALCALFLNEDATLIEWIEYHLMIGVSTIFLYHLDNHIHKNRWRQLLWPYVSKGQIKIRAQVLTYLGQWSFRQVASLQHCYDTNRYDYHWIAFVDIDEFIVPRNARVDLPSLLRIYSRNSGLVIPWRSFGPIVQYNNNTNRKLPRITETTNATLFDYRVGVASRLSGTVKIIVNTRHESADHCHFGQNGFENYVHNCLCNAPIAPVDERFRKSNDPWILPFPTSNEVIQINHYIARTCSHYFGEKQQTRIINTIAQFGDVIPNWYKFRLGIGLGKTDEESCTVVQKVFNTTDNSIVELGQKLWNKLDNKRPSIFQSKPPDRTSCQVCLPQQAICVDLLQRGNKHKKGDCVCRQPMIGDGRTFCGNVTWATSVQTPTPGNYKYLLSAPDGNPYASHWATDPASSEYRVYFFGQKGGIISNVRMILIYQPFSPTQIIHLSYIHRTGHGKTSTNIDLTKIQRAGKKNPSFMMIPVGDISLTSLLIRFDIPILLGGVGIVIT